MEKDKALNLLQNGLLPQVHGAYYEALKMAIDDWKPKLSEDCISRQAVLNKAKYRIVMQETRTGLIEKRGYFVDVDDIKALVRVLPKQKVGKWVKDEEMSITFNIYKCSTCGCGGAKHFRFCPSCGSLMLKENEE